MTVLKGEELARQTARLERLMAKAMSLAEEAGVPVGCVTKVGFNHRAHEMGMTRRVRAGVASNGETVYRYEVSLSDYFVDCPDAELLSTLAHELVHTVADGWGHGVGFNYWARKFLRVGVNVDTKVRGARAKRVAEYAAERMEAYRPTVTLACKCRRHVVGARTNVAKHPEDYRCKHCGCALERA